MISNKIYNIFFFQKMFSLHPLRRMRGTYIFFVLIFLFPNFLLAQKILTEKEAIDLALKRNPLVSRQNLQIEQAKTLQATARTLPQPEAFLETPNRSGEPTIWANIGISQSFQSPKLYRQNAKVLAQRVKVTTSEREMSVLEITQTTRLLYQQCVFLSQKQQFLQEQDSIFNAAKRVAEVEARLGNITPLQRLQLENLSYQAKAATKLTEVALKNAFSLLENFVGVNNFSVENDLEKIDWKNEYVENAFNQKITNFKFPQLVFVQEKISLATEQSEQQRLIWQSPNFNVGINYFFVALPNVVPMARIGVTLPLQRKAYSAHIEAAKMEAKIAAQALQNIDFQLKNEFQKAISDWRLAAQQLNFVKETLLPQANEILRHAQTTRALGSLSMLEYLQSLKQVYDIRLQYLEALRSYQESVIQLKYFVE